VLYRDDRAVSVDLDDVADARQAERVMPDRKGPQGPQACPRVLARLMDALVQQGAADRGGVVRVPVFEEDEPCLPGQ
jgi:hypothetical protein